MLEMDVTTPALEQDIGQASAPNRQRTTDQREAHLITEAVGGNEEAFVALVRPRLGLFTNGIHRILQDANDTQTALQEALLNIQHELDNFHGQVKFSTWAYRICLDQALRLRRSRMRNQCFSLQGN